ncbi:MAG: NAD-dependent succinate-semialdehyde dehydrogenase [Corynebacterium sp.]|nr:NAD-dependent succinate-semialdehyde dehydrogenase [Corynebacterium sp.]
MSRATYRTQNPVTNEVLATFDIATDEEIAQEVAKADAAFRDWSARSFPERATVLNKAADLLEERIDKLVLIGSTDMGKRYTEMEGEIKFCAEILRYYAENGERFAADEEIPTAQKGTAIVRKLPLGVLLGVMPWNFPYYQVVRMLAPNLMLGNTIVLKHAGICAASAEALAELFRDAGLPEGGFSNLFADHEQVEKIIADPRVQGVSLTGSERAGETVAALAGKYLKRSVLELGGNDPFIILDSADVKESARLAWSTRMKNTGQTCTSNKRIFVHAEIYDEFVAEITALAEEMKKGTPADEDPQRFTPLSSRDAAENLDEQVQKAIAEGATLCAGGKLFDEGAYYSPTVLTNIPPDSDSFHEEFFGPVAAIYRFETDDEVVALANDSQFGLGGAVFSTDVARAKAVAAKINTGMISVNAPHNSSADLPFGGIGRSGYGRELGPVGMDEFVNKQTFFVSKN